MAFPEPGDTVYLHFGNANNHPMITRKGVVSSTKIPVEMTVESKANDGVVDTYHIEWDGISQRWMTDGEEVKVHIVVD